MISIWTLISAIIWVAATTRYITKWAMQKKTKKLKGLNEDLKKALSEMDADREEIKQIAEIAMHEWKSFMRECHNLRDLLRIQEGKTKSAEVAAEHLKEKIAFWKLEHAKDRAIIADIVQKLQAKDRENIRLSDFILKLNRRIKHYREKMKKLYSEPNSAPNKEVWTMYEEVLELVQNKKGPDAATSEPSTINRGQLRLQA